MVEGLSLSSGVLRAAPTVTQPTDMSDLATARSLSQQALQ